MRNVGKYAAIYAAVLLMSISLIAENGGKKSAAKSADVAQAQDPQPGRAGNWPRRTSSGCSAMTPRST